MSIQDEFPPEETFGFDKQLADAYTRLRARAVEMERVQDVGAKIRDYRERCVATYSKFLTDYGSGVLQGIDCALAFLPPAPDTHKTKPCQTTD